MVYNHIQKGAITAFISIAKVLQKWLIKRGYVYKYWVYARFCPCDSAAIFVTIITFADVIINH